MAAPAREAISWCAADENLRQRTGVDLAAGGKGQRKYTAAALSSGIESKGETELDCVDVQCYFQHRHSRLDERSRSAALVWNIRIRT
jgi:hypothetical protein